MTPQDQQRISDAIRQAEARCNAEIICVLARRSSAYSFYPLFWSSFLALLLPWPLLYFTLMAAEHIYLAQLGLFVLAGLILSQESLRFLLVPRRIMQARAHRAALEQFVLRGVTHTANRNGMMIFVSMAERWARIIVDDAIAAKIPTAHWQQIVNALLELNAKGQITQGFLHAIDASAAVLSHDFPPQRHPTDALPNRIYLI